MSPLSPADIRPSYLALAREAISFPSVSADPAHAPDILACAAWYERLLTAKGAQVSVFRQYGNPILLARFTASVADAPTTLLYGHYDVQPASLAEGWTSDPWLLTERGGRLYARGAADNKGQAMIHLATLFQLVERQQLGRNVVLLLEGEEEVGSANLERFVHEQKALLAADEVLISDGSIHGHQPVLELGYRGCVNATLTVRTSDREVHSGQFGGSTPNAIQELVWLLRSLYTDQGTMAVAGLGVPGGVPADLQAALREAPFNLAEYQRLSGTRGPLQADALQRELCNRVLSRIEITGIEGGYRGAGYRNSIAPVASAKLNIRLEAGLSSSDALTAIETHLRAQAPSYVDLTLEGEHATIGGVRLDKDLPAVRHAEQLLERAFGQPVAYLCCGATLPVVSILARELGLPQVLAGLANDDCGMHAVDENIELVVVERGLAFSLAYFGQGGA
jgi:acetylornithine deacetylase/succinyl-diaminopimelate desuccinylase-like protein